jgi:signal peptidase II
MSFYALALGVILLDQLTKTLVVRNLRLGQSIPILPGCFDLVFVLNPGAAFGVLAGLPERVRGPFFVGIALLAVVLIVGYRHRHLREQPLASAALALVLGGAVGNLIDRLRSARGVVDFIDIGTATWRWPTFNVADAMLVVGVALLLLKPFPSPGEGADAGKN